jgi:hypothetical protein
MQHHKLRDPFLPLTAIITSVIFVNFDRKPNNELYMYTQKLIAEMFLHKHLRHYVFIC